MHSIRYFLLLCCSLLTASAMAQPKYFTETFDKAAGWKLSAATPADSASFEIKDGSLILTNKQRNVGMVELEMPFSGDLGHDAEWQLRLRVRHLDGVNNYQFGICQGAVPGTSLQDGFSCGLAANGYYRLDSYYGKNKTETQKWTRFNPMDTTNGAVNDIRIIYREPWGMYVLINNQWAFSGNGRGRERKTLTLFAEGHQTVAFDQIELVSYRGQYTKMADIRAKELQEICAAAVDSFSNARGFRDSSQYKTWLPEIFIANKNYKIFRRTDGVFPKKVSRNRPYFVYMIPCDYTKAEDRDTKKAELQTIIEKVLVNYKPSKATLGDRKATYYFAQNPDLPKGTVVVLQEYTFRRSYEKEDHYYLELMVLNAPDVKAF